MISRIYLQLLPLYKRISYNLISFSSKTFATNSSKSHRRHQKIDTKGLASNLSLDVIGNGSDGNPSALFLSSDEKLYLFNCSEGLQRLVNDYKENLKLSKTDHLFITSNKWHNISGISGSTLSRFDSGVKELIIHGIDCEKLIQFCNFFDFKLKKINFIYYDYNIDKTPFIDDLVDITSVPIITDSMTTIAYICKIHPKRGVFLIDKCYHLKIPRKLVPNLQSRQSITLENGLTINPEEVHTPDEPEKTFIVLECPSIHFIDSVLSSEQLNQHINQSRDSIECVVHFTPEDVINNRNYQLFIQKFSSETKHLIINKQNPSFSLHSLHRFQTQLNLLDSKVFPFISEKVEINKEVITYENTNIIKCQTGLKYVLRPSESKGINFNNLESIDFCKIRENACKDREGYEREGFLESLQDLKAEQKLLEESLESHYSVTNYPEVVFLGTGSAMPNVLRNVSSILVNTSADSSILLDCGEDTFGQLMRYYGSSQMSDVFKKLKAVFISHQHSDHHMGLIQMIKKHYDYTNERLVILVPPLFIKWINIFNREIENISSQYHIIPTNKMQIINNKHLLKELRLKQLKPIPVLHCVNSFGILLQTQNNQKIVYSGDAEPSDQLIEKGQNCDLLIHEATVEDILTEFARDHFHSTVSEAIEVGRKMNAKFTVLTHFSQRYAKLPIIPETEMNNNKIGIAYDFMRVTIPDLNRLPLLLPSLKCLYAKHLESLKTKGDLYQRRFSVSE